MTMSNAQAALIAAANQSVRGSAVAIEPVLKRAEAYLEWLEGKDTAGKPHEVRKEPIVQCTAASANYTRCMLASGHKGEHRNSQEGEYWGGEKPVAILPPLPVVHFYTGLDSAYAPCGKFMANETPVSAVLDAVTCTACRGALGL